MATHDVGDLVTLWSVFTDALGAQADPTAVTLTVRDPSGVESSVTPSPAVEGDLPVASAATGQTLTDVTGVYKGEVAIDSSGLWRYRWEGTGAITEAGEGSFHVRRQRVE